MAFLVKNTPRTKQPQKFLQLAKTGLTKELFYALNPGAGLINAGLRKADTPAAGNGMVPSIGKEGKAWSFPAATPGIGEVITIGPNTALDGVNVTIFIKRRVLDTTNRSSSAFASDQGTPERLNCHMPFSDGVIYWDHGDSVDGRISWSGYSKDTSVIDNFLFHHGTRGKGIWYNGSEKAFSTTSQTRTPAGGDLRINRGTLVGDRQEVFLFYMWNRQLADSEIESVFENPWRIYRPRSQYIQIPSAGGPTPFVLGQPLMGPFGGPLAGPIG